MKSISPYKERRRLQRIMMEAFKNEIQDLAPELQYMLTDDLVTAFQNRLDVFQRFQTRATL